MEINLIVAPQKYGVCYFNGCIPNVGLLSLASFIKSKEPKIDVKILDGEILTKEEIIANLSGNIIGLSVNLLNYKNSLEIAQSAKEKGKAVIVGGPYATHISENILKNREYIDAVVVGEGEFSLLDYVRGEDMREIDNLVYRENGKIINNNREKGKEFPIFYPIRLLPEIDYALVNIRPYRENFSRRYKRREYPIPIYTHKGCSWREKNGGCIFCCIDRNFRLKNPTRIWREICHIVKKFNIAFIRDIGDNITSDPLWLKNLLLTRPKELEKVNFFIYARPDQLLKPGVIDLLEKLNMKWVSIGFESGSQDSLRTLRKGMTIKENEELAKILVERHFKVFASFVLGAPGESERTIDETRRFAESLKKLLGNDLEMLTANPLTPYPGSNSFEMILKESPKYRGEDLIDPEEITEKWVRRFCNFSWNKNNWYEKLKIISTELDGLGKIPTANLIDTQDIQTSCD